jgi:hypothetical protein
MSHLGEGDSSRKRNRQPPPPWLDVTLALQYLVADGALLLHGGLPKSGLMGFADPAPHVAPPSTAAGAGGTATGDSGDWRGHAAGDGAEGRSGNGGDGCCKQLYVAYLHQVLDG